MRGRSSNTSDATVHVEPADLSINRKERKERREEQSDFFESFAFFAVKSVQDALAAGFGFQSLCGVFENLSSGFSRHNLAAGEFYVAPVGLPGQTHDVFRACDSLSSGAVLHVGIVCGRGPEVKLLWPARASQFVEQPILSRGARQ